MKGAPSDQIQLHLLLQCSAFLLSATFDDTQLFPSVSVTESLAGISKVPAAGLFQGSVLGLQRVDEELSCFHGAGGTAGSMLGAAGSLLNSTFPLQAPGKAREGKMLWVVTQGWCFPASREPETLSFGTSGGTRGRGRRLIVSIFRQHIPQSSGFSPRNPPLPNLKAPALKKAPFSG